MNKEYSPQNWQGILNEKRFFQVLREAQAQGKLPEWIVEFGKASEVEDKAGVDGHAILREAASEETWKVPFQIKSSAAGIILQQQKNSIFWMDKLRYFVIHPFVTDEEVVAQFIETMAAIHRKKERFPRVLALLEARAASEARWKASRRRVEQAQSQTQEVTPALAPEPIPELTALPWWRKLLGVWKKISKR